MDFNARFNTLLARLSTLGVKIAEIDQINHYFNVLESHFSQWAECCKGLLRQEQWLYNTEGKTTKLSLLYFQEDLLAETRNSASTTFQQLSALQATYRKGFKLYNNSHNNSQSTQPTKNKGKGKGKGNRFTKSTTKQDKQ